MLLRLLRVEGELNGWAVFEACKYLNVLRLMGHSNDMGWGRLAGWYFPFRHVHSTRIAFSSGLDAGT